MTLTIIFLVLIFLGPAIGYYYGYKDSRDLTPKPLPPEIDLYKTLESAQKTIEESWKQLNPPHHIDCDCAYCEIKNGITKRRTDDPTFAPAYVAQLQKKIVTLKADLKYLRAMSWNAETKPKQPNIRTSPALRVTGTTGDAQSNTVGKYPKC